MLLAIALVCAVISAPIVLSSTASRCEVESTFAFTASNFTPNAAAAVFVGLLAALAFLNLHHVSEFLYFKY